MRHKLLALFICITTFLVYILAKETSWGPSEGRIKYNSLAKTHGELADIILIEAKKSNQVPDITSISTGGFQPFASIIWYIKGNKNEPAFLISIIDVPEPHQDVGDVVLTTIGWGLFQPMSAAAKENIWQYKTESLNWEQFNKRLFGRSWTLQVITSF